MPLRRGVPPVYNPLGVAERERERDRERESKVAPPRRANAAGRPRDAHSRHPSGGELSISDISHGQLYGASESGNAMLPHSNCIDGERAGDLTFWFPDDEADRSQRRASILADSPPSGGAAYS